MNKPKLSINERINGKQSLEEGFTASRCNLIDNGDFGKELSGFSKTGSSTDGLVTAGESIYKSLRYLQVVNSSSALVYASPSTSSTVLETLSKGARVAARTYYVAKAEDGTTTNWYEVDTTSGKRGYILSALWSSIFVTLMAKKIS